jgi:hypothetical protein
MKKWTIFVGGKPYMVQAGALRENDVGLFFEIDDKVVGRFLWAKIDGYMEVK